MIASPAETPEISRTVGLFQLGRDPTEVLFHRLGLEVVAGAGGVDDPSGSRKAGVGEGAEAEPPGAVLIGC
jgi:hypothetical protein